jgi:diaminohydroxyphosphoribosylaminopyrimidine deaminase/5-amino-6-(5-phosphoribosylamino)uracil reductase
MVEGCNKDFLVLTTSVAAASRRTALERHGVEVVVADGPDGRPDLATLVRLLADRRYESLMIEAGSKLNWAALESGVVDRIYFYYAPKILGGMQSLPVAGGIGKRRRKDAIVFHNVRLHHITEDEFAVQAWLDRSR